MAVKLIPTAPQRKHIYSDINGTYQIDKLFTWINRHPEKHQTLNITNLLKSMVHEIWDIEKLRKTHFSTVFFNKDRLDQMNTVDLQYPIIILNTNHLIDGIHRLFKAIFDRHSSVKAVFIDIERLNSVLTSPSQTLKSSLVDSLPIPDTFLNLPNEALPKDSNKRKGVVEDYFPDFLPTATPTSDGFEIRLERPCSPYGSYEYDPELRTGLSWWKTGTRIRDICAEHRLYDKGLLALEEQWIPLSWSHTFQKLGYIPNEIVLLHLDDHQDMMSPRIGQRLDGAMVDYLTGKDLNLLDPKSVASAIRSGGIGKGSILTPLIWSVPKTHVRHLTFRPHPNTTYKVDKITYADEVLFSKGNRLGLHFSDTSWRNLSHQSSYVVTPNFDTWLKQLPKDVPILLHFDMDYFNNRFDGDSEWNSSTNRQSHNPSLDDQMVYLKTVFQKISELGLSQRIINTTIGISPGFYPAEFWKPMIDALKIELEQLGLMQLKESK